MFRRRGQDPARRRTILLAHAAIVLGASAATACATAHRRQPAAWTRDLPAAELPGLPPAAADRPDDDGALWSPRFAEVFAGAQANYGGPHWVAGGTLGTTVETSASDELFARLVARFNHDHDPEHARLDDERDATWAHGRLMFGALPLGFEAAGGRWKFGVRGELEYIENTPASIESSLRVLLGPAVSFERGGTHARLLLGGHFGSVEVDDDLPRQAGIERHELERQLHGLAAAASLGQTIDEAWFVGLTGRFRFHEDGRLTDIAYGAALDVPLRARPNDEPSVSLRLSAEQRVHDRDAFEALPYHHHRCLRLEVVVFPWRRSWRTHGY